MRWHTGDLIDEATYTTILEELTQAFKRNAEVARQQEKMPIIQAAKRLGLSPAPSGTSPTAWQARCPGANHQLYISSKSNTFGCGWCKREGGPEALKQFVEDRAHRR